MPNRLLQTAHARHLRHMFFLMCSFAVAASFVSTTANAQQEVPIVISPLRVESDRNGVNLVSGKIAMQPPALSVPGAPNLRFDRVQNLAPYVSGKQSGGAGSLAQSSYSVHRIDGTSDSFSCVDFDCKDITGSGSEFMGPSAMVAGPRTYWRGGTGEFYRFDLQHVRTTTTNPVTLLYYASSVTYPNGEVLTFTYETATLPGDTFNRTFYRPTRVSSNLGFYITISYHPGAIGTGDWGAPAVAAIYSSSDPATPLQSLSYSSDGSTITDIGGRVYTCSGCQNSLGSPVEVTCRFGDVSRGVDADSEVTQNRPIGARRDGDTDGVTWNYGYPTSATARSRTATCMTASP